MTGITSAAGTVAARVMNQLGIHTRAQAREFLTAVMVRQLPRLSVADVSELLDHFALNSDPVTGDVQYDRTSEGPDVDPDTVTGQRLGHRWPAQREE
jgi:hypothetical protein